MLSKPLADRSLAMDHREEKIRVRAYEIWEREGFMGDPEDHWFEAEREILAEEGSTDPSQDRSEATVEEAPPVEAVEALEAATSSPAKGKRSPRSSKD
jgi:Protein of unknown function (DUF2934)